MASNGQWEVVRKNPKKTKQNASNNNKPTKSEVREFLEKMPKLDEMVPLKESHTMFEALMTKSPPPSENKNHKASKNGGPPKANTSASKEANKPKKKHADKKKEQEKPPRSLEEAMQKVNTSELQSLMTVVQLRFPESPNIWLKDLVAYLNLKLNVDVPDSNYSAKDKSYPMSLLPEDLRTVILETLEHCNPTVLQLFFERSVVEMVEDMAKGLKVHGYRLILQMIAQRVPEIITKNLAKYVTLRNSYQNRPNICLSVLWIVGQGGVADFEVGLKAWLEVMLPVLCMKSFSKYVADYLSLLFSWHPTPELSDSCMDVRDFFPIFDTIFKNSASLDTNLHTTLLDVYPKVKSLAFGPSPQSTLRLFFPSFLNRLQSLCPPSLKSELLSCLVMCLKTDVQCFSVWRQMYTRHFSQSSVLLQHLLESWDKIGATLPRSQIRMMLTSFSLMNEELATQKSRAVPEGFTDCKRLCTEFVSKMISTRRFPWRAVIFLLLPVLTGWIIYDCQLHGSFKASKTGRLLQDVGLLDFCERAWGRLKPYLYFCYHWAEKNVPVYYAVTKKVCEPYLKLFLGWFAVLGNYVLGTATQLNGYLLTNVPLLLKWVDGWFPGVLATVGSYFALVWQFALRISAVVWTFLVYYNGVVGDWLLRNVFTGQLAIDKLQQHAYFAINAAKVYATEAFQWISQQMSSK